MGINFLEMFSNLIEKSTEKSWREIVLLIIEQTNYNDNPKSLVKNYIIDNNLTSKEVGNLLEYGKNLYGDNVNNIIIAALNEYIHEGEVVKKQFTETKEKYEFLLLEVKRFNSAEEKKMKKEMAEKIAEKANDIIISVNDLVLNKRVPEEYLGDIQNNVAEIRNHMQEFLQNKE